MDNDTKADAPLTPDEERALREAWPRTAEALRSMAQRANTARGASWEHGARCATHLLNAVGAVGHLLATLDDLHRANQLGREARREKTELAARVDGAVAKADLLREVAKHERAVYTQVIARLRDALRLDASASVSDVVKRAEELAALQVGTP